jgi:hypothetical protein
MHHIQRVWVLKSPSSNGCTGIFNQPIHTNTFNALVITSYPRYAGMGIKTQFTPLKNILVG